MEAVAEFPQRLLPHLLLLVGEVLSLAGLAHAVALDGLGQDHGRPAGMPHGVVIGRVHLVRVVAAAVQSPQVLVGHACDHGLELGVLAEEMLADVGPVAGGVVLILAVDALLHALLQKPAGIAGNERVPVGSPDDLDDVPARAAEHGLQLLAHSAIWTPRVDIRASIY
jgi:hypothetical protein